MYALCDFAYPSTTPQGIYAPRKQSEGSYLLALPMSAKSSMAWFDTPIDYGLYVRAAIESPAMGPGSELLCGSDTTWEEVVSVLSRGMASSYTRSDLALT